ncbi:hypothetical protein [Roseibium aggregatum]|uniref:hypothetical protein n=1 Tax=Roseibium aggregatum TaxID=187304 RepID=UPI001A906822|nr:hypothetical protein [Roseibium aggregatum]MBN8180071.1 hypothetical protein [Roseibium aggregatum]UES45766.1 hypothetical protein GFK90_19415 [Roseibium aggregatum]
MSEMNFYALTSSDLSELQERFQGEGPFAVGNAEFSIGIVDGVPTVVIGSAGEAVAVAIGDTWNELVSKDTNGQTYNCD